jgi:hypothetical protein
VASGVVGAIEPRLRQSEIERVSRKPTESLDAYDLYLRALALRDTHTDESMRDAIALLKRALAIDPNYVPAKAAIGWSRLHQAIARPQPHIGGRGRRGRSVGEAGFGGGERRS